MTPMSRVPKTSSANTNPQMEKYFSEFLSHLWGTGCNSPGNKESLSCQPRDVYQLLKKCYASMGHSPNVCVSKIRPTPSFELEW